MADFLPSRLRCLVVGHPNRLEFHGVVTRLRSLYLSRELSVVASIEQAALIVKAQTSDPDWIVLLQSQPDQFDSATVVELVTSVPLTRTLTVLGSWCEGETRTGRPLPVDFRIFWYECDAGLQSLLNCKTSLVRTLSDEERWQYQLNQSLPLQPARIGIACPHRDAYLALQSTLAEAGHATRRVTQTNAIGDLYRTRDIDALIWDDAATPREQPIDLATLFQNLPPASRVPTIALLTFPRIQTVHSLQNAGVSAVMGKPFSVSHLIWQLNELTANVASESQNGANSATGG